MSEHVAAVIKVGGGQQGVCSCGWFGDRSILQGSARLQVQHHLRERRPSPTPTPLAMWMTAEAADITDDCPIGDELAAKYGLDGAAT